MKDHQIRYQVIVADDFALLFTVVLANDALAPKRDPLDKAIPRFGGIGRRIDGSPHLLVTRKVEEEDRAHDTPELAKGCVQLVLMAVGAEPA
jgi:hypothetical protein